MVRSRMGAILLVALLAATPWMIGPSVAALAPRLDAGHDVKADDAPGIILVGLRDQARHVRSDDLLAKGGARGAPSRARVARAMPSLGVQVVQVEPGSEEAWLERLRSDPRVSFAERDHRVAIAAWPQGQATQNPPQGAGETVIPTDPSYSIQWALATLRMPEAWRRSTGAPDLIIAIVDTGVAADHPDLAGKLWTNGAEIAGNGLDDDGNGYIDDVHGWHFYHTVNNGVEDPAEDANNADEHGHGTHIAGIVGATTNNGLGIAGISWGARIMAVRALGQDGTGWYSDVAAAVTYAVDNGARIINLSLGDEEPSALLCGAIQYAHSRGSLVVAAAGNSGGAVFCPANCPYTLAVAASDSEDRRAPYSNYGPEMDLTAPGSDIYSTWRSGYARLSGTSMAAAQVSGVASLVWSLWPGLDPDEVADQLERTAVDIGAPGPDPNTGSGRIDAAAATLRLYGEDQRLLLPLLANQHVRGPA